MPVLRKRLLPEVVNDVWRRARSATRRGDRPCPVCADGMAEVGIHEGAHEMMVEACERCQVVWFDFDALESLPEKPPPPPRVRERPEVAEALVRLQARRDQEEGLVELDPFSADALKGLAGLPQIVGAPESESRPWVTWALATAILGLTILPLVIGWFDFGWRGASYHVQAWAKAYGFVPADPLRHGGLTLLTTFFLHGGWFHVLFNAYFLVVTSEGLESQLGRGRLLLLLLASILGSTLLYWASAAGSESPLVGASGGISGLFAYYALALPKVRLDLTVMGGRSTRTFGVYQLRIPVRWAFGLWILAQFFFATSGAAVVTNVAYGAHLGGALAGLLWWVFERMRVDAATKAA